MRARFAARKHRKFAGAFSSEVDSVRKTRQDARSGWLPNRPRQFDTSPHSALTVGTVRDGDGNTVAFRNPPSDSQTKACPFNVGGRGTKEAIEDAFFRPRRDAGARIDDLDDCPFAFAP